MANNSNRTSPWPIRLDSSEKAYKDWSDMFKCDILEKYYEGFQWKNRRNIQVAGYNPYQVNLFYSTIKIKMANFMIKRPQFLIGPKPGNSDWDLEFASKTATLKQDTLNTIIGNMNINFTKHIKLAALDSFFRFGLLEIGYATDWRNPQKADPELKSWTDTNVQPDQDKVVDDNEMLEKESFYVKRIKPKRFRVAAGEATDLKDFEWFGYYENVYTNILKKTKGIKWPKDAPDPSLVNNEYSGIINDRHTDSDTKSQMLHIGAVSKVWHIFDNISHTRSLFLDDYWKTPLYEEDCYRMPLIDLRWDFRTEGFYPIPPCFQWLSPQDEINEAREQTRSYRRRFTRKFQVLQDQIDEEEKEKFASGEDGILVTVKKEDAIKPIENPALGQTVNDALLLAKDDFISVSGSSQEVQKSDRETATKSAIEDQRARIRESAEQIDFADFICLVGREILATAQEKMALGMWIKLSGDPINPSDPQGILQDMHANTIAAQYITHQDINDGYDYEIELDVINGTPVAMEQQQKAFVSFLGMITQFPMLAMSPMLIRQAAYICGYRNEAVIAQIQQAAIVSMAAQATQKANAAGMTLGQAQDGADSLKQEAKAQMATPAPKEIGTQIANQMQGSTAPVM